MNPNGRPKGSKNKKTLSERADVQSLIEPHLPKALMVWVDQLDDDNQAVRSNAASQLWDRGRGKAAQYIESKSEVITNDIDPLTMARKIAFALDNAERLAKTDESVVKVVN